MINTVRVYAHMPGTLVQCPIFVKMVSSRVSVNLKDFPSQGRVPIVNIVATNPKPLKHTQTNSKK